MSNAAVPEVSKERCLLDMPYEILFEILRKIPHCKLIEISRLCSKFRDIAEDPHIYKDVYIKYYNTNIMASSTSKNYAFEELYSGPWLVNAVDLSQIQVNPPVFSLTDQVVKVTKLILSSITADKVTMEAIMTKYQCTELKLENEHFSDNLGDQMGMAPEAFSKQTALKVLSLGTLGLRRTRFFCHHWLPSVLSNCKNLKTLNLDYTYLIHHEMMGFVNHLPKSLAKLFIGCAAPTDYFFELLVQRIPTLKELGLSPIILLACPSLLKFQFLQALHVNPYYHGESSDLHMFLTKFPGLKTVHIGGYRFAMYPETNLDEVRTTLKRHGIIVKMKEPESSYPADFNFWQVYKTV